MAWRKRRSCTSGNRKASIFLRIAILAAALTGSVFFQGVLPVAAREIRLVTLNWEPYYGANLPNDGFGGAIARAAFERAGHELTITYMPWARALREARSGHFDGILGAYKTEARARHFYISESFASARGALVARPGLAFERYESLYDLIGYSIAVGNGFAHTPAFDQAGYLRKIPVNRVEQMVHMLFNGHVDMALMSVAVFRHHARKLGYYRPQDLKVVKPLVFHNDLHILMSRNVADGTALIADFNRGLAELKADGTYNRIRRQFAR